MIIFTIDKVPHISFNLQPHFPVELLKKVPKMQLKVAMIFVYSRLQCKETDEKSAKQIRNSICYLLGSAVAMLSF